MTGFITKLHWIPLWSKLDPSRYRGPDSYREGFLGFV